MILTVKDLQNKIKNDRAFRDQLLADFPDTNPENAALNQVVNDIIANDDITNLNENLITIYLDAVDKMRANSGEAGLSSRWAQYIRVPFGEDTFSINANNRTITIPASFKTNGIAVAGDHLAEVLYFDVDRFYDLTDLSLCNISIQWRNLGGKSSGNDTPHASAPFAMYATSEKVYFGWIVDNTMTAFAGNIEFAVVFSMKDQDVDSSTYGQTSFILNTQAAQVKVNSAIGFTTDITATNYATIIQNRPMYSHIINTLNAAEPIIRLNLVAGDYNLENDILPISWTVAAISPDGGTDALSFRWEWDGLQLTPDNNGVVTVNYPATAGTLVNAAQVTITETDLYQVDFITEDGTVATVAALDNIEATNGLIYKVEGTNSYYVYDNNAWVANPVIGRKSTLTTNVPGRYDVLFGNRVTDTNNPNYNGVRYVTSPSVTLIPAGDVEFDDDLLQDFYYYTTGAPILRIGHKEGDNIYTVHYQWYQKIDGANDELMSEDLAYTPTKRGTYYCTVTNTKNNSRTTDNSKEIFIEMIPQVPDNRALIVDTIDGVSWDRTIVGVDHKIKCHINPPLSDETDTNGDRIPLISSEDATYKVMCSVQELNVAQPKFISMDCGIQPSIFTISLNSIWNELNAGSTYEVNILFTQATLNRLTGQYEYAKGDDGLPKYATQDHSQTWIKFIKEN